MPASDSIYSEWYLFISRLHDDTPPGGFVKDPSAFVGDELP